MAKVPVIINFNELPRYLNGTNLYLYQEVCTSFIYKIYQYIQLLHHYEQAGIIEVGKFRWKRGYCSTHKPSTACYNKKASIKDSTQIYLSISQLMSPRAELKFCRDHNYELTYTKALHTHSFASTQRINWDVLKWI